jgi:copper chaperone NosL
VLCLFVVILAACEPLPQGNRSAQKPATLTADAIGYYCRMALVEHSGPQAQMYVEGEAEPIWFSQVRDAVVYLRSPEELRRATAIFVSDMATAPSWDEPGVDNWIPLGSAHLVIESARSGGMGAPEVVPFGTEGAAQAFVAQHGGRIVKLEDVPDSYVLSPMAM